jgi:dCMP deaminase
MKLHKLDNYYKQALAVAELSPDEETKVGALLINIKTGAVLGSGYNGFVRKANDGALPKKRPEKYPYMVHAEANAIYNSARHGIRTEDCFVFCTLSPCIGCCRALYQSGIDHVVFKDKYRDFDKQKDMLDLALDVHDLGGYYMMTISPRILNENS